MDSAAHRVVDDRVSDDQKRRLDLDALSRQVAVYDIKSQLKLSDARVFITGLNGWVGGGAWV